LSPARGGMSRCGSLVGPGLLVAVAPGRAVDLDQQRVRELLRDDVEDGAPPRGGIDLDGGVADRRV